MHLVNLGIVADYLGNAFPVLAGKLRKTSFASLPTPISHHKTKIAGGTRPLLIKHDDETSSIYGGNKVRKLEYILQRAMDRGAKRVATFGTVGSNHALATSIHARELGLECTLDHEAHGRRMQPWFLDTHRWADPSLRFR